MNRHQIIKGTALLSVSLMVGGLAEAQTFEHPGGLHTRSQIETARKNIDEQGRPARYAYRALIKEAKKNLQAEPQAIEDFNVPGYYQDAKGHREMMDRLSIDSWLAYSCALAYQTTSGDERKQYAEKAVEVIDAWATTNKKTSNYDGNLAMVDAGAGLVFAAELMTDYEGWDKKQRAAFETWLTGVYMKSCKSTVGCKNNWGNWGVMGCAASHYYLDDVKGLDADIEMIRQKIDEFIEADGTMPHETKRGERGIWYTYFALSPLTAASQIAANARGVDLFHYKGKDGAGIEEALDYLLKYCYDPEDWPHCEKGQVIPPKPDEYPGNLYEAMYGIYGKTEYKKWIKSSRPIMVFGHHYSWNVPTLLTPVPPK